MHACGELALRQSLEFSECVRILASSAKGTAAKGSLTSSTAQTQLSIWTER